MRNQNRTYTGPRFSLYSLRYDVRREWNEPTLLFLSPEDHPSVFLVPSEHSWTKRFSEKSIPTGDELWIERMNCHWNVWQFVCSSRDECQFVSGVDWSWHQWYGQYSKIGKLKEWNSVFFHQRRALSMSFDIFIVRYRVTNFSQNLWTCYYFQQKKTEFPFCEFPYFRVLLMMCP